MNKLYAHLPAFAQNLAISIYGWYWKQRRFGGSFEKYVRKYNTQERWNKNQWEKYQTLELRRLLSHANRNVPFYQDLFSKIGLNECDIINFSLDDLSSLPILEKEELRLFGKSKLLSNSIDRRGSFFSSSGSTGTPISVYYSVDFHRKISALMETRVRQWAGVTKNDPRAMIGGRRVVANSIDKGPFYRYNFSEKQIYFSAYHISKKTVEDYYNGFVKYNPKYITGYASGIFYLASLFNEVGINEIRLKCAITSSEKLTKKMRTTIEQAFNCPVFDSYSGVENCGLISQHPNGNLYLSPESGILQIVDSNDHIIKSDKPGDALFTGLLNFDQPLIRYRIGDVISISNEIESASEIQMPIVKDIIGRIEDKIEGPDGRVMSRFHSVFINCPNIKRGQIIQNSISEFEIRVESDYALKHDEVEEMINVMKSQLGDIHVEVKRVDQIPTTKNGKFKAVVRKI